MNNIQTIYDSLWEESIQGFKNNVFELDNHLNERTKDKRRGLSLIGRLDTETLSKMIVFLNQCKLFEPNQHYYDQNDIHITILSIISCYNGFDLNNIAIKAYIDTIANSIIGDRPIRISFKGITASPSCIMIQGFPQNDSLKLLRQQLRENFKNSNLQHSIDKRYFLETAHSTIIRFKKPLADNNRFLECLEKYRDYDFGNSTINKAEFVYNDWYMTNSVVSKIRSFSLLDV